MDIWMRWARAIFAIYVILMGSALTIMLSENDIEEANIELPSKTKNYVVRDTNGYVVSPH
ncbi:hypothetical protein JCM19233_7404 [Vibrio astriarenae]|uniref:Uncharacterized protein n=1 Tax=Vibrio astriarenae TaxID=1481923 RepID=A0A7Z2YFC5_9VIBR|nr:hypothetical protein [Vibrio astriarenae]QIA65266.1 hypothetical protein GT360_17080 [Vibrio astriarenae]GAL16381.1 hypothetical protein JCM19233_7404 [Vibrio sp. C7]